MSTSQTCYRFDRCIFLLLMLVTVVATALFDDVPEIEQADGRTADPSKEMDGFGSTGGTRGRRAIEDPLALADLTSKDPEDLVRILVGEKSGVEILDVRYKGTAKASGTFALAEGQESLVGGFSNGVVLTTGFVADIRGPNKYKLCSRRNGMPGDGQLNTLVSRPTFDASVLEFDFKCAGLAQLSFNYVFASDEYNEWVGTAFNDVFGFFLNGKNIALLPDNKATSINNVNCGKQGTNMGGPNCAMFRNNADKSLFIEMDGLTQRLTAVGSVSEDKNTIRLAIADVGDYIGDSAVLIEGGSFKCILPPQAKCKHLTKSADEVCQAKYVSIDDGSFDDGKIVSSNQSPSGPYELGTTSVELTVVDNDGMDGSCEGSVTVVDTTNPTITCPVDIVLGTEQGTCSGRTVVYDVVTDDNCGVKELQLIEGPASGEHFGMGVTEVVYRVTDFAENTAECSFTVTIKDMEPPSLTCQYGPNPAGNEPASKNQDGFYILSATDNCATGGDGENDVLEIYVGDSGSDHVFGPYPSGTKIKYVQAPGAKPNEKPGVLEVDYWLTGKGDGYVFTQDEEGNKVQEYCLIRVPPQGKQKHFLRRQ